MSQSDDDDDVKIINPLALATAAAVLATTREARADCGAYSDAPACSDENDVCGGTGCSDVYRGCAVGSQDCADNPLGNPDDVCCAGLSSAAGEHIDHAYCFEQDAVFGGISLCWSGADTNWPPWIFWSD